MFSWRLAVCVWISFIFHQKKLSEAQIFFSKIGSVKGNQVKTWWKFTKSVLNEFESMWTEMIKSPPFVAMPK